MFNPFKKQTPSPESASPEDSQFSQSLPGIKDLIAPAGMRINPNYLQLSSKYAKTLFILTYPRYLQTGWFSPIIDLDISFDISMYVYPVNSAVVLKNLK